MKPLKTLLILSIISKIASINPTAGETTLDAAISAQANGTCPTGEFRNTSPFNNSGGC